jgi:hypothetical protein
MAIVILDIPMADTVGINAATVTKVSRGPAGRVHVWQGATRLEVLGTFEKVIEKLNGKG